jgi:GNAT superfamily N-acetyltransferase
VESISFKIRPAREDDISKLFRCYEWLFAPPGAPPPHWDEQEAGTALREAISSEAATVLVAEVDTALIGFATAYQDLRSVRFGLRAWVEDLAVAPEHRSRGVGKALLEGAKAWAREHGATRLALDSGEARRDAHRFYERERPSYRSISFGWFL